MAVVCQKHKLRRGAMHSALAPVRSPGGAASVTGTGYQPPQGRLPSEHPRLRAGRSSGATAHGTPGEANDSSRAGCLRISLQGRPQFRRHCAWRARGGQRLLQGWLPAHSASGQDRQPP